MTRSNVAIITARGGSKRIPRKNIRPFRGKPIIAWSIEAALESKLFETVMVTTDCPEIATIAREFGAETPFLRSAENSDDYSTTSDVLLEVLECYEDLGQVFELACCLYPTAPFVTPRILKMGLSQLKLGSFDVVMPVARFDYPIWRSVQLLPDSKVVLNFPENLNKRSQDLPPAFHDAGQWYWFNCAEFKKNRVLMGANTGSLEIPLSHVQDIDTLDDWFLAETKHKLVQS